jgi:hypothetical protein
LNVFLVLGGVALLTGGIVLGLLLIWLRKRINALRSAVCESIDADEMS